MAEERKVKRWITVNGAHVPIYEDTDEWMPSDMKVRYSRYIDDRSFDWALDSDEKTWVEALRAERDEQLAAEQNKKNAQIQANAEQAKKLNAEDKEKDKEKVLKPWSKAEDQRSKEMSKYVTSKTRVTREFQEFYEENFVEDIYKEPLNFEGFKDDEISMSKMNLVYAQNYDENDNRVKRGKPVTGSTYYVVQTEDGAIDENNFAYKTKADAEHAMKLYIKELTEYRARSGYKRR